VIWGGEGVVGFGLGGTGEVFGFAPGFGLMRGDGINLSPSGLITGKVLGLVTGSKTAGEAPLVR
jgi:hypothetical protein